jgi:putative serine protease PepD
MEDGAKRLAPGAFADIGNFLSPFAVTTRESLGFTRFYMGRSEKGTKMKKLIIGFVIGASVAGGVATAAGTFSGTVTNACVDNNTGAIYANSGTVCPSNRSAVTLGSGSGIKYLVPKVEPSVVTVDVTAADGSGDTGSGEVIRSDATGSYIVTNNHVIDSYAQDSTTYSLSVDLSDGRNITAKIIGRDTAYDLAVLHITTPNLPVIAIGDSSALSVGDPVIAFGSPLGLDGTVTAGIVSSLNRPVTTQSDTSNTQSYVDAIQTDAAINPGNSGGALTDSSGRLVGINCAIASLNGQSTNGSIGLGFAIPINEAMRTVNEIIDTPTHTSTRPVLGVYFDTTYTGVGAKISQLVANNPASNAGIPVGAIVTNIAGTRIPNQEAAIVKIRSYAPGATVSVTVTLPTGGSKTFQVTLGSAPSNS